MSTTTTDRFTEAVTMQQQGMSTRRIAKNLKVSTRTVIDMLTPVSKYRVFFSANAQL